MKRIILPCVICAAFTAAPARAHASISIDIPEEIRQNGVAVIDVFDASGPSKQLRRERFISFDGDLAARLWQQYAPTFGETDWSNADPALRHEVIILSREGRAIVLRSSHRITESGSGPAGTARGADKLSGRASKAVLRSGPPEYLAKMAAFDRMIEECDALREGREPASSPAAPPPQAHKAEQAGPVQEKPAIPAAAKASLYKISADFPERMRAQQEKLRGHERRSMWKNFTNSIRLIPIFVPFSIPWFVPLLMLRKAQLRAGLAAPLWLLPALALSPLGWTSAISITSVTKMLIVTSILAPAAAALLLRLSRSRASGQAQSKYPEWALTAALLVYGSWSAASAAEWSSATSMAGSSEGAALGQLSSLRSSVQVYYGDTEGAEFPAGLHELLPRYMDSIPRVNTQSRGNTIIHTSSDRIAYIKSRAELDDKGGWCYVNEPKLPDGADNPEYGNVYINCTHTDIRGRQRLCDY